MFKLFKLYKLFNLILGFNKKVKRTKRGVYKKLNFLLLILKIVFSPIVLIYYTFFKKNISILERFFFLLLTILVWLVILCLLFKSEKITFLI